MALKIQDLSRPEAGMYKFAVEGRLDGTTSGELESTLRPVLAQNPKTLVLDMAGLDFISSAGIRTLIETQKVMSANKGSVLLVNLQPQILKVLEIIKALPGITVFRSVQEMDYYLAAIQRKIKSGE
ncbi:STAS domain-containing protein [bacterium]|nr:STAS domain-containing protein [bacterium]MCI0603141.1 STAS domain-containing protein [bacterium]